MPLVLVINYEDVKSNKVNIDLVKSFLRENIIHVTRYQELVVLKSGTHFLRKYPFKDINCYYTTS